MRYVADMLGFVQPGNDYILKELAIVALDDSSDPLVKLFESPYSWNRLTNKYKKENTYLRRHYHGLDWNSGTVPYTLIGKILRDTFKDASIIYVSGSIQKKWLERFKFNVKDIAEYGYPPLDTIKMVTVCENHDGYFKTTCALHNVKLIKKFIIQSETSEYMEWV